MLIFLEKFILFINGAAFVATSFFAFFMPVSMAKLIHFSLDDGVAYSEFLANFGGMYGLFGGFFLLATCYVKIRQPALMLLTLCCAGLVFGRVVGYGWFGMPSSEQVFFGAWECVTAMVGAACLIRFNKSKELLHGK